MSIRSHSRPENETSDREFWKDTELEHLFMRILKISLSMKNAMPQVLRFIWTTLQLILRKPKQMVEDGVNLRLGCGKSLLAHSVQEPREDLRLKVRKPKMD